MPNRFFVLEMPGWPRAVPMRWALDGRSLVQIGTAPSPSIGETRIALSPGETVEQAFGRVYNWVNIATCLHETILPPGGYFPRMARPIEVEQDALTSAFPCQERLYISETAHTAGQLISLVGRLQSICQVVEPVSSNLQVFGHEIRECLLVAAMEVESNCKAILRANGVDGKNTADYARLLPAMKLDEYEVVFSRYPGLAPVRPFAGWTQSLGSQSLPFYAAYNAVKHDRETAFEKGMLEHALKAVAGCAVLAAGQFGWHALFGSSRSLEEFFSLASAPAWGKADTYMFEADGWPARAVQYPF